MDSLPTKTIATLTRRMMALRDRIESLTIWMARHSDLSHEMTQLHALAELANEWCHDIEEVEPAHGVSQDAPPSCLPTPAPASQGALL